MIKVEFSSKLQTEERPVAFQVCDRRYRIKEIMDQWYGIHRILDKKESLFAANVIVVVAGMDGALASVVGGLVEKPVVAVPTSIGYGASFQGVAALLTMLNSCATGVAVVNIDNGFGGGYFAHKINILSS